jgi:hypothetical protein
MKNGAAFVALAVLVFVALPTQAMQIAGVNLPAQVRLEGLQQPLHLNGAGIRKKLFVKVYVAALYLPKRTTDAQHALTATSASRMMMQFVYSEVSRAKLDDAWDEGFSANLSADAYRAMQGRLQHFKALFQDMREGDRIWLDYLPGVGTSVTINGKLQGVVQGADFNRARLSVWLGKAPVAESLKEALLGADI